MPSIEVTPFKSQSIDEPTFHAPEFLLPNVTLEHLSGALGRFGIYKAIESHQQEIGLDPQSQAWAGINGVDLYQQRTLFDGGNPDADEERLNKHFNATPVAALARSHCRS